MDKAKVMELYQSILHIQKKIDFLKEEFENINSGATKISKMFNSNIKILLNITTEHHKEAIELKNQVDAIAAQLKNILFETDIPKSSEMSFPNQYQTGTVGSSSGPRRDNIPTDNKGDSISVSSTKKVMIHGDKRDTKTISIIDQEDKIPLNPNEEKYVEIVKIAYKIQISDSYFISPGNNVYPRMTVMEGGDHSFIKIMTDYGFMDLIYSGKDLLKFQSLMTYSLRKYPDLPR